jgi:hypothetical protein
MSKCVHYIERQDSPTFSVAINALCNTGDVAWGITGLMPRSWDNACMQIDQALSLLQCSLFLQKLAS